MKTLANARLRKEGDALSKKSFDRIRDRAYKALMRPERGMPDAERNLATVLNEAWNLLNTTHSPELKRWLHAITPAVIVLLAESQEVRTQILPASH